MIGTQRLTASTPRDSERYSGGADGFPEFKLKFNTEVMTIPSITAEEQFLALQDRVSGNAKKLVKHHLYTVDKKVALKNALDELRVQLGCQVGHRQR